MDLDKYKWIKGTRKALERVPYRLTGQRIVEDADIAAWTKDFHSAKGALQYLAEYSKESASAWKGLIEQNKSLLKAFQTVAKPIADPDDKAASGLIPENPATFVGFDEIYAHLNEAEAHVNAQVSTFYSQFGNRVAEAKESIKLLEALLQKLGRKQLDFERFRASSQKALESPDEAASDKAAIDLREAEKVYLQYSDHVKSLVPQFLAQLNTFLTGMTAKQATFLADLLQSWGDIIKKSVASLEGPAPKSFSDIYEQWITNFTKVQYQVESLGVLRDGNVTQQPMSAPKYSNDTAAVHGVKTFASNAYHGTENLATNAYSKISHIHVPDVQFHSHEEGIFGEIHDHKLPNSPSARKSEDRQAGASEAGATIAVGAATGAAAGVATGIAASKEATPPALPSRGPSAAAASTKVADQGTSPANLAVVDVSSTTPEYAIAKFDYSGDEGDIIFSKGDRIRVIDHGSEGDKNWWLGEFNGKVGLFPADYVENAPDTATPTLVSVPETKVEVVDADHSSHVVKEHILPEDAKPLKAEPKETEVGPDTSSHVVKEHIALDEPEAPQPELSEKQEYEPVEANLEKLTVKDEANPSVADVLPKETSPLAPVAPVAPESSLPATINPTHAAKPDDDELL